VHPLVDRSGKSGGRRQGRYVLGDLLGRGGMAEVFSGHSMGSHGFQKPVAIKRLLPELANDHVFVERLIGEAKLLVGMQHGNIVSVLDLARDGEDVFLVMEFVDGPSLRQLLKARGSRGLPIGVATYIVQSAAAGLEFAHGRHVIHADISPSNLLLTTSGEVRVADFGIARREGNGAGVVEGKWAYMAPEQARGEPLAPRSDVFALGVVLYELITGQHPLGRQITADERESGPMRVVPPRVVNPSIPAGIDAICMKALAHDARDRYARMQQLIDALVEERWTNGWREGASDLAAVIRECAPAGVPPAPVPTGPSTQHTDRPVTIITRSLISATQKPAAEAVAPPQTMARGSAPAVPARMDADSIEDTFDAPSRSVSPAQVRGFESGARTSLAWIDPALAFPPAQVSSPELASVHGGSVTVSGQIAITTPRSHKWTFGVLGIAALFGISAAIAMQIAPDGMKEERAEAAPVKEVAPPPAPVPQVVTVPVPVPAPVVVEQPAPVAQPAIEQPAPAPIEQPVAAAKEAPRPVAHKSKPAPVHHAAAPDATLRIVTEGGTWAKVSVGSDTQDAPGAKFHVAAGNYTVRLRNTDLDVSMSCRVSIESGKVVTLHAALEDKSCFEE
jgi:serine/threonine-protein kinase